MEDQLLDQEDKSWLINLANQFSLYSTRSRKIFPDKNFSFNYSKLSKCKLKYSEEMRSKQREYKLLMRQGRGSKKHWNKIDRVMSNLLLECHKTKWKT